ncbi:3-oxoadipate enol-lactonase 2 [Nocardioides dokdonensis FR1436]|uniref:3-oxoadipate enol-lactonase 2 n=1 Tax=Nocardioides dokdonensis FR1436 TaxID=1300347 RepID=A0A1A9GJD1_9ACTN|nr:alpha/beta hydrolase [Nocardioides dokdonensis]ANH38399.1 3-oxoadipate enol-lactonase 2 [Nocardioides dokdonensis FR1436]
MSRARRVLGVAGAVAGVAAAGTAAELVRRRRDIASRDALDATPLGSLRAPGRTVIADDGVPLHVEVDELDPEAAADQRSDLTIIFVHGYALSMGCWHFQRAAYRGLVRSVFYDQRSHGRSGRSSMENATIDQLGSDLARVLEEQVPEGPVVLVGHSMGGMTIVALAEQHPELFGSRVVGVGLVSTTAGGLDVGRLLLPVVPAKLAGPRLGRALGKAMVPIARGHRVIDLARRWGASMAMIGTDLFAFGGEVPESYVRFVDRMLAETPFEVVAEFFPSFSELDKFHVVDVLSRVPVSIICGTADRMTSIGHSRKLHARIQGSSLLEVAGAGHMVVMESHDQVNAELDQLLAAAAERAARP